MQHNSELKIYVNDTLENGFSPLNYKSQFDLWGMACLYQGICMYDDNLNLSNRLSQNIKHFNGYTEVKLKKLNWHNGEMITAEDFKYSFELFYKPNTKGNIPLKSIECIDGAKEFYAREKKHIDGIEIVDDYTFKIYHNAPSIYIHNLLTLPIIPKHYDNKMYIGSGSYILESFSKTKSVFRKNQNFCLGSPYIENVILEGGTKKKQIYMLKNKEIDLSIVEPSELYKLPKSIFDNYYVFSLPQPISTVLKVNPNSWLFSDCCCRKTISQKINRNFLISKLFFNHADAMLQFYPPVVAQHLGCAFIYQNVAPLKNIIKQNLFIGYNLNNRDHLNVIKEIYEMLKQDFNIKSKGFNSNKEAFDSGADLYIDDMYHNFTPDSNFFLYREQERMNCESQYNKLITLEKKIYQKNYKKYIKQIATELADVLPVIPLYSKHEIQLVSKSVHNLKPDTRGAFWNIHELIIEEKGNL